MPANTKTNNRQIPGHKLEHVSVLDLEQDDLGIGNDGGRVRQVSPLEATADVETAMRSEKS
jgi:hypothetical protein